MTSPIICFGQQPCGFFPKRFLVAKIQTARRLQKEIGGEVVFFLHDSDHDPRETKTILRHKTTNEVAQLNFTYENKTQRKFSPLYLKRIPADWQEITAAQLRNYVDASLIELFKNVEARTIADFCLDMYSAMGFLDGIKVVRSSDKTFRRQACDIDDFFVDVEVNGNSKLDHEIVRARFADTALKLHEGGDKFLELPMSDFTKEQISPSRDSRLKWMQSVLHCTHYVAGASEQDYLRKGDAPEIEYMTRDTIDRSEEAHIELS
jgi:hypothetical protein